MNNTITNIHEKICNIHESLQFGAGVQDTSGISHNQLMKNNEKVGSFAMNVHDEKEKTSNLVPSANIHLQPTFFTNVQSPISMVSNWFVGKLWVYDSGTSKFNWKKRFSGFYCLYKQYIQIVMYLMSQNNKDISCIDPNNKEFQAAIGRQGEEMNL